MSTGGGGSAARGTTVALTCCWRVQATPEATNAPAETNATTTRAAARARVVICIRGLLEARWFAAPHPARPFDSNSADGVPQHVSEVIVIISRRQTPADKRVRP